MLAFENQQSIILVDCGGDVIQRLMAVGVSRQDLRRIEALIVTHEHADHVSGFPLFMEKIWLAGRRRPIPLIGIKPAIEQARRTFECFDTSRWEGLPEIELHEVELAEGALVLESDEWRITATLGIHSVPVTALRIYDRKGGGTVAYSCDTRPSEAVAALAQGADILVHEATGAGLNHSSAREAARIAQQANAKRLVLVHLPPAEFLTDEEMGEAKKIFAQTEKGEELGRYEF
jgi:ribonuclease Z